MNGANRDAEARKFLDSVDDLLQSLGAQPDPNTIRYVRNCLWAVRNTLAPFQVGDRAALSFTPDLSRPNHGWRGAKHFLVAGCPGTVRDVTLSSEGYSIGFEPDNQTWIPSHGDDLTPRPMPKPGLYYFRAEELYRLPAAGGTMDARPIELTLKHHIATFYGPSDRSMVEVWSLENDEYRVIRIEPFPPPTRGDKVTSNDATTLEDALTLAAAWRWQLWHVRETDDTR